MGRTVSAPGGGVELAGVEAVAGLAVVAVAAAVVGGVDYLGSSS